jgi:hypothetical protein
MASKVRCRSCREYFAKDQMHCVGFCCPECLAAHRNRQKPRKAPVYKRPKRDVTFTPELKAKVRERDGNCCKWCGAAGVPLEVHHIIYRSAQGSDTEDNLVALCNAHHLEAHSDIKRWQPILLLAVSEGLTVPQADRAYEGHLPDGPWRDHPHGRRWMSEVDLLEPASPQDAGDESLCIEPYAA